MRSTRLYLAMAVAAIVVLLLGACGPQPTAGGATQPPAERKVATFIWTQEFDSLNPLYTNMWFSAITQQIWNCWAWDFDDTSQPRPVLVKEIPTTQNGGISADGKVITLKLRDDIVWSDGTPLTSADFVFTYQMTIDPKNTVASVYPYDQLESVTAPDARTVVMTFKEPFVPWMSSVWHGIIPKHILQPVYDSAGNLNEAAWNRNPTVGCGPFVVAEWKSGNYARFVANDKYWLGRPKIDEIFMRFVADDAAQVVALKAGDGDLGTFISYADIPDLQAAGVKMINVFSGYNEGIYFRLDDKGHPALKDLRVRKAIALATNREALCQDLLLGLTVPAATDWDMTPWVDPSIKPWPYDPDQAKALLDEAGWKDSNGDGTRDKDGVELVLRYGTTTREVRQDTQAVLEQQLAQVGIKVELLNIDKNIFFSSYSEGGPCAVGDYDIFEYSAVPEFPDPNTADWLCSEIPSDEKPQGTNWGAVCDPELDALLQQQAQQLDYSQRQQTFWKITKIVFENVYWLGLWQDPDIWAVGARLQNVKISGVTPFFNVWEWDLTQ